MTYLLTFCCYGAHVAGDVPGAVDRVHHIPGSPTIEPNPIRAEVIRERMSQRPYTLDDPRRKVVLAAIRDACAFRGWSLAAAHVRSNHVHVVVDAPAAPEPLMGVLKARASRWLGEAGLDAPDRRRWARHGSTRYLWNREQIQRAIHYVADLQGPPMALRRGSRRSKWTPTRPRFAAAIRTAAC
ncbi:MAG: transposase [Bryobacteraceae bacterium]